MYSGKALLSPSTSANPTTLRGASRLSATSRPINPATRVATPYPCREVGFLRLPALSPSSLRNVVARGQASSSGEWNSNPSSALVSV